MLTYWEQIFSIIQPDLSFSHLSMLYKISWKAFSRSNLWFITVFAVESKKIGENSISVPFYFFNKILTVIWYLKHFVSCKRSLNKFLMLDLLASDCDKGSFLSINSTLYVIAYPPSALAVFTILHKKEAQKVDQCLLNVWFWVFQCMCYKMQVL